MKLKFLSAILLSLALPATTAFAKPSKADEKFLAETWSADTKTYADKTVETFIKSTGETGMISSDQAFAAVPVLTATSGGEEGGQIILLVPPADVKKTLDSLTSKSGGKGSAFGSKMILQKLSATFRVVGGEPALVKGGDASKLAGIGKPSDLYAKQAAAAGIELAPPAKYPKKDFLVSKQSSTSALEKYLPAVNKQRLAENPKAKPYTAQTLQSAIRGGAEFQVDDDSAKTTWVLKWK